MKLFKGRCNTMNSTIAVDVQGCGTKTVFTLCLKKRAIFLSLSISVIFARYNINRFSIFFHGHIPYTICNNMVTK